ncbi:MAG: hybrid sensor histidine kinase/response regulator [Firmicutes bacterium HGW-Firmicutes-1]|jgi:signal transduction histidine kinase/CheY-like chemotaxis protein|nr:MAG: hybrid sensor histidine kinase/response regulator [Firmicutes bacterium HGW-Firmicutes-1]
MKNVRIGTQLIIGFTVILFFVIVVGVVAYVQTDQLNQQTENIYEHPLQVRRAIGALNTDVLNIRMIQKDLMVAKTDLEKQDYIQKMKLFALDAEKQFGIIKERYLGASADVEQAYQDYIVWKTIHEETDRAILSGEIVTMIETEGSSREKMLSSISKIDEFAINKGNELYRASNDLKNEFHKQLLSMILVIILLSAIIGHRVLQNIRKPLNAMNDAVLSFNDGDLKARSLYISKNEFGVLSASINNLADLVQENTILSKMASNLAEAMLRDEDARKFFQSTLGALAEHTGSQMAAVYLLKDNQQTFEHFESLGMAHNAKPSFEANCFEGEFGAVLLTRKLQYIQNIPEDTRFEFNTVGGKFIPREIITIPIISGNQVIAVISLATLTKFAAKSIEMIDNIMVTLSTRIEGILAYRKIKEFKEEVEQQNRELTAHKSELSAQTVELVQQNAELEMQKKQLDEASRLKTNFLSNMSHELRTPLNSVIALSGVLNRRLVNQIPEEEYSYLEIIERNGKNLLKLINDVLDISRIEAGREEIEISQFNVNNLIADVVIMIQPQSKQKNIELLHESSGFDLLISSDTEKCRHVLQNLIGNAVKFTDEGKVVVSAVKNENSVEIRVTDTGIGIAKDYLEHIFEEFRQADGSSSRRFGGTGLGLAIAKRYANLLGGTISVNSTPEVGSEFIFSLPRQYKAENRIVQEEERATEVKYPTKQQPPRPMSNSSNKTILLVEDNESAVIQIKDLVEEMGYEVLVAHDAVEAFGMIDRVIPDAMILDLMMPDIDGFKVLEMLRNAELTAHIPVLVLTAKHITKEELKFLKRNNIHQLIQKGDVDRMKLQSAVFNMLYPETIETKLQQRDMKPIKGKPVVLIVEDNPDNMITAKALLSNHYTVIEAVNAYEGIEMAKENVPHLILMDIALSGMSGIEAFLKIRKMSELEHIPVIALTASAMDHDRDAILSYGFDAFVAKPIVANELFEKISEVIYGK